MRIHSIRVRDFRGIEDQLLKPLPTGVTIVAGPNEVGKTSLAEAVDLLFERLDSSTAAEVREAQPLGRDVGPEVEVEAQADPFFFRYRKRFIRQPETELEITAPRPESLTGREAHERVDALLVEAGVDLDLWRALRVVQGVGVGQPQDLAGSPSLLAALDRAAAGAPVGEQRSAALFDRSRDEYQRYFTDKRGDPRVGGPLHEARAELAAARQEEAALAADMEALEGDARRAEELQRARAGLAEKVEQAEAERREASAALQQVERLEEEIDRLRSRVLEQENLRDLLHELADAREAEGRAVGPLESAQKDARRLETDLAPAEAALAAAEGEHRRAEEELERARQRSRLVERLAARRGSLDDLEERWRRAEKAARRVEDGEAMLSTLPEVDEEALAELERLHAESEQLSAALSAASPRVQVSAIEELSLTVSEEGRSRDIAVSAGDEWKSRPSVALHLTFPGVAEVTVTPGGDVTELASRLRAVEMERTNRLQLLGVEDVESARSAHGDRRRAESALQAARAVLNEVAAGRDLTSLTSQRDSARAEVDRLAEELVGVLDGAGQPPSPDAAERAVTAARAAVDTAQQREREARNVLEEKRQALETARGEVVELRAEHRGAVERRRRALRRLAELASLRVDASGDDGGQLGLFVSPRDPESGDDDGHSPPAEKKGAELSAAEIDRALESVDRRVATAREELATARARLSDQQPAAVHQRASEAAARHDRLADELRRAEDEHLQVITRLESAGERGLFEKLRDARARLAAAERRAAAVEARAAAARRLFEVLSEARAAARLTYSEPLRQQVEELGRPLFGDDFAVELGDDLTIVRRTAFGRTLEVERLSTGAREQLSLLLRLACALLVSPQQGVPLILDDVLGHSDPTRLAGMVEVLGLAGERCQVLVLTSVPDRYRHLEGAREVHLQADTPGSDRSDDGR